MNTLSDYVVWLGPAALLCVGWLIKKIASIETAIFQNRIYVAETYATRNEVLDIETKIDKRLERIEGKIDDLVLRLGESR